RGRSGPRLTALHQQAQEAAKPARRRFAPDSLAALADSGLRAGPLLECRPGKRHLKVEKMPQRRAQSTISQGERLG
ncbi:MAG: hypothetical protein WBC64_09065, partial [Methylovirgula sp.]